MDSRREFLRHLGIGIPAVSVAGDGLTAPDRRGRPDRQPMGMETVTGDATSRRLRALAVQEAIDRAETQSSEGETVDVLVPGRFGPDRDGYDASVVEFNGSGGTWGGRMVREGELSGVYDVRAYGAAGDGTLNGTDDTTAIQAALDDVPEHGATVHFPVGAYRVTQPLVFPRSNGESGLVPLTVQGESRGWAYGTAGAGNNHPVTVIFDSDEGSLFDLRNGRGEPTDFRGAIRHLTLEGKEAAETTGIEAHRLKKAFLFDLRVDRFGTNVRVHDDLWYSKWFAVESTNARRDGVDVDGLLNGTNIYASKSTECGGNGWRFRKSGVSATLHGCWAENNARYGVRLDGRHLDLQSCYLEDNGAGSVRVSRWTGGRQQVSAGSGTYFQPLEGNDVFTIAGEPTEAVISVSECTVNAKNGPRSVVAGPRGGGWRASLRETRVYNGSIRATNGTNYESLVAFNDQAAEVQFGSANLVSGESVMMPDLPESDPGTPGQLWNDDGVLRVSES